MFDPDRRGFGLGIRETRPINEQRSEGNPRRAVVDRLAARFAGVAGDAAILIDDKTIRAHKTSLSG